MQIDRAIAVRGEYEKSQTLSARYHLQTGNIEQARKGAMAAIALDRDFLPAYVLLSEIDAGAIDEAMAKRLQAQLQEQKLGGAARTLASSALGRALEFRGDIAHYYKCFDAMNAYWRRVTSNPAHTIRYEEFIEDFEPAVMALLKFCGLEMEVACLRFHESDRPVFTLSAAQVREGVNPAGRGSWRAYEKHLTPLREALEEIEIADVDRALD